MAQGSLAGIIKEMAQKAGGGLELMKCTAEGIEPLKLRFEGDSIVTVIEEGIVKPAHIGSIAKGDTVLITPIGDGDGYFVMGVV